MNGQTVIAVAVGLSVAMWIAAAVWANAAKRRDAERSGRSRRPTARR